MNTPAPNDPHKHDPVADLLDTVRVESADDALSVDDLAAEAAAEFDALAALLPAEAFDPVVLAAVERVVDDSESVGIPTRKRLIAGAERGVRWHRRAAGALPPLLQEGRRVNELSAQSVAEATDLPEQLVHQVERGDVSVDQLQARQLATWIRKVNLNTRLALDALKRTLQLPDASTVYAASGNRGEPAAMAHKEFYDAVARELGEVDPTDATS